MMASCGQLKKDSDGSDEIDNEEHNYDEDCEDICVQPKMEFVDDLKSIEMGDETEKEDDSDNGDDEEWMHGKKSVFQKPKKSASKTTPEQQKANSLPKSRDSGLKGIELGSLQSFEQLGGQIPTYKQVLERMLTLYKGKDKRLMFDAVEKELKSYWVNVLGRPHKPNRSVIQNGRMFFDSYIGIRHKRVGVSKIKSFKSKLDKKYDCSLNKPCKQSVKTESQSEAELNRFFFELPKEREKEIEVPIAGSRRKVTKKTKIKRTTVDYYDENIGCIVDRDNPTPTEFGAALLREIMMNTPSRHPLHEKIRLGTLLIHLSSKMEDFSTLYQYYHQVETDVANGISSWSHKQAYFSKIEENILESVKEGITSFNPAILETRDSIYPNLDLYDGSELNDRTEDQQLSDVDAEPVEKDSGPVDRDWSESESESGEDSDYKGAQMPTIRCQQCTYMTHNAQELDKHMFNKHSHGTLCLQCGIQSETYKEYEKHMDIHVLDCEECDKPFHGLRGLRRHKLKVHMPEMRTICKEKTPCHLCGKLLNVTSIEKHIKNIHNTDASFPCDQCDYVGKAKEALNYHIRCKHKTKCAACPVCGKVVKMLRAHMNRNGCVGDKKFQSHPCPQCSKCFKTEAHLKKHKMQVHEAIKNYKCDQCDYATYSNFNLRLHSKMHTGVSIDTICEICNKKTGSLSWHMNLYHPEVKTSKQDQTVEDVYEF